MGSCLDLRQYQDTEAIQDALGKVLSGKSGYRPIVEKRIDPVKCENCGNIIRDESKFCPNCGTPVKRKPTSIKCKKCSKIFNENDTFCGDCGLKRE